MSYCAPSNLNNRGTCFNKSSLLKIAKAYNITYPHKKIKLTTNKDALLKSLKERFNNICGPNDEQCWLSQNNPEFVKIKYLEKTHFRPSKPCTWNNNPNTWLNSNDIQHVMIQYQEAHKDFNFIGVFPIDFSSKTPLGNCISQEMCQLNIKKMYQNRKQLGFIFNLDRHDQSGSHWVALFISLNPNNTNFGAYYYDSATSAFPHQIKNFMLYVKKIIDSLPNVPRKFEFKRNSKKHQFKNTECGMFSMYFLVQCLSNAKIQTIYDTTIDDNSVSKFRDVYYRPNLSCKRNIFGINI